MFTWIPIHEETAKRLLKFKNRSRELAALILRMHEKGLKALPANEKDTRPPQRMPTASTSHTPSHSSIKRPPENDTNVVFGVHPRPVATRLLKAVADLRSKQGAGGGRSVFCFGPAGKTGWFE